MHQSNNYLHISFKNYELKNLFNKYSKKKKRSKKILKHVKYNL